jgi:hypothetical protein
MGRTSDPEELKTMIATASGGTATGQRRRE